MPLEVIVEIGNKKQKELVKKEISDILIPLQDLLKDSEKNINRIKKIIIPKDLEKAIREHTNRSTYKIKRHNVEVIGKSIKKKSGTTILLSNFLYTKEFDTQLRFLVISHEIAHEIFEEGLHFDHINADKKQISEYLFNKAYEEYRAERFAFSLVNLLIPQKSDLFVKYINDKINNEKTVLEDEYFTLSFNTNIQNHIDGKINLEDCFNNIVDFIEEYLTLFFYYYSLYDSPMEFNLDVRGFS